jgi:microcin C transport system substrate-binding protein
MELKKKRKATMKHLLLTLALILFTGGATAYVPAETGSKDTPIIIAHAIAMNGEPKYGPGFTHFDYVNPKAPKGGTLRQSDLGSFDSLHPYIIKGNPAAGLGLLFDTLMHQTYDEPFTMYGLIAEKIEYPADRSWIIFHINKKARFQDGTPVKASDVLFSFNALVEKGNPLYARYYADVKDVKVLDPYRIKFSFSDGRNRELPLILGQLEVLPEHYWKGRDFSMTTLDPLLGSGPYKVETVDQGRSITYILDENYWGRDLPVNRGQYNFKRIRYDYYQDETVRLAAFKSGEFDFIEEKVSKQWATAYVGPPFEQGLIKKESIKDGNPSGMQCFVVNQRRELFKDRRVRYALAHAFDFEWTNQNLFYSMYKRTDSYFENSEMQAHGPLSPDVLKILEPFRDQLWPEVYTRDYAPPSTAGENGLRKNLRKAFELLSEAGWTVKDGVLRNNASGKAFTFEILLAQPTFERVVLPFASNLKKLGIQADVRVVDTSQYINRMRDFDFDMVVYTFEQSSSPGNEQRYFWSSEAADVPGTRNFCGIKNKAVDQLVELVISAGSRQDLVNRCKALDQALLWGHYVIPHWYNDESHVAYTAKVKHPANLPPYNVALTAWWIDPAKAGEQSGKTGSKK